MRFSTSSLFVVAALSVGFVPVRDAFACGGCFHEMQQMESTVVTGHRMLLSVSTTQTTLWDQIEYSGSPASFAWVLPVKGMVDVGISSDALFSILDDQTRVRVSSPPYTCAPPPVCDISGGVSASSSASGASSSGGVVVVAQEAVGPYATVQLSSQDPQALSMWLATNGYDIPPDIQPIIAAYVAEGFDFLAVKLLPGMGIQSMKPIRVTTPGAGIMLPLRMVSAGTGANVPITLWVMSEGAYVPSNFPSFTIAAADIVWDWDSMSSNYKLLRESGYAATQGKGWLIEASEPKFPNTIVTPLSNLAQLDPIRSGYADAMGMGAPEACAADMVTLFAGIDASSSWISRLRAQLPRSALATDLTLMASPNQSTVTRDFVAQKTTGKYPCVTYPPCENSGPGGAGGAGGTGGSGGTGGTGGSGKADGCTADCAIGTTKDSSMPSGLGALALGALAAFVRTRMKRKEANFAKL